MNNLNSLHFGNAVNKVTALINKINATCDALVSALEVDAKSVGTYGGVVLSKVEQQPEFVDVVLMSVFKIKNHLRDLKTRTGFIKTSTDLHTIVHELRKVSERLENLLHSNGFFYSTFQLPMSEIQTSINEILTVYKVAA